MGGGGGQQLQGGKVYLGSEFMSVSDEEERRREDLHMQTDEGVAGVKINVLLGCRHDEAFRRACAVTTS